MGVLRRLDGRTPVHPPLSKGVPLLHHPHPLLSLSDPLVLQVVASKEIGEFAQPTPLVRLVVTVLVT
jgi:hypothetical protein